MDVIGPLQLRVMKYIWKKGPSTVHAVHDALNEESGATALAYTTILTVMRNLAKRGILEQAAQGRSHIFTPQIDEETYKKDILLQVRNELFGGKVKNMVDFLQSSAALKKR